MKKEKGAKGKERRWTTKVSSSRNSIAWFTRLGTFKEDQWNE